MFTFNLKLVFHAWNVEDHTKECTRFDKIKRPGAERLQRKPISNFPNSVIFSEQLAGPNEAHPEVLIVLQLVLLERVYANVTICLVGLCC